MTPQEDSYRIIPLTQGQLAIVDAADYEWLNQWKWFANYNKCTRSYYAGRQTPRGTPGRQVSVWMHREILGLPRKSDGRLADHINHVTMDNRRSNLRIATCSQNSRNHRRRADNPSGFIGVSFYVPVGKWRARIAFAGRQMHLGYYATCEEAAGVYRKTATKLFGEFVLEVEE